MTDKEIIKALECCLSQNGECDKCPQHSRNCVDDLLHQSLDLINRQKAEIEKLTINMNAFGLGMIREKERADTSKAEAIKEFAERLQDRCDTQEGCIYSSDIGAVLNEMVGGSDV